MTDHGAPQVTDLVMDVDDATEITSGLKKPVIPSHRIPPEIIVKIIQGLLPEKVDYGPPVKKRLNVLLIATSICRYWRYAALDHATLWSIVPIDRRSLGGLFLQRSRNASLSIIFEVNTRRCCPAHQAMVLLLPHMQRVKKVQFRAPAPVLNEIFTTLNSYIRGAQLEEISVRVDEFPGDKNCRATLDLLLGHASTLKVLRLDIFKCRFPVHKLRQFSHLSHLELLSTHDVREVSPLLTSLPALTSIKVRVCASGRYEDNHRIVPQANLQCIHLQIACDTPIRVLDTLKIPAGVHLECEMMAIPFRNTSESTRFLPFSSQFFENTSHIEELRISLPSCSGSGPSGSFSIDWVIADGFQPPIEDFSYLRTLTVDGTIEQQSLKDVVRLAPRLVSVVFVDCAVIKSRPIDHPLKMLSGTVGTDAFVKAINEERRAGRVDPDAVVNGTLEGERLEEFRSLL